MSPRDARGAIAAVEPPALLAEIAAFMTEALQSSHPVASDVALAERARRLVGTRGKLEPAEQVDVYRRQFHLRHRDSLLEDFPGLAYVLEGPLEGDASPHGPFEAACDGPFDALVAGYLRAFPPRHPSLRDLALDVPRYVASVASSLPSERRTLAVEMARYELALVEAFDGPDAPVLLASALEGGDPTSLTGARLSLHPSVRVYRLAAPAHLIRHQVRAGGWPALTIGESPEQADGLFVVVSRPATVVRFEGLAPLAARVLRALGGTTLDGEPPRAPSATLSEVLEGVADGLDEAELAELASSLGAWFSRFLAEGLFCRVEAPAADG
jgi:hypothetical protein